MSNNVYTIITERIIALLAEQGTAPWQRPWRVRNPDGTAAFPQNMVTGRPYRGINVFLLGTAGFPSPAWMTYRQAQELGGQVRAGVCGLPVVFFKSIEEKRTGDDSAAAPHPRSKFIIRYHTVFNRLQVDGLLPEPAAEITPAAAFAGIPDCDSVIDQMPNPPAIRHAEARAWYSPQADLVNMPVKQAFNTPADYYATLFHELTHATGHASRLARAGVTDLCPFGSTNYSKEELVAEMGAAYLCALTGIDNETIFSSAAYIQGWIAKLRSDVRLVVQAGAAAQRAADYILGRAAVAAKATEEAPASD